MFRAEEFFSGWEIRKENGECKMVTGSGKHMKKVVTLPDKIEEPGNEPFRYSGHIH